MRPPARRVILNTFTLSASDGLPLYVYRWMPEGAPRGVVQISHGMAEHAGRYEGLARALNVAGFAVYAHDHRGHGRTAPVAADLGFFGETAGWGTLLDDLGVVQKQVGDDFPGTPIVLLGHSMGAFVAQQFAAERGGNLRALVLSGTYQESRALAHAGALLARLERWRLGARGHSRVVHALTIGAFNRRVTPTRTPFDWLSRDAAEVDRYRADPLCGFPTSVQLWVEVLGALGAGLPLPPAGLPVYLLAGERDPVCQPDPGATKLAAAIHASGNQWLTHRVYPGARHELFLETNRDEVIRDLLAWLDAVV
jgi:alpha-beta hydrolase superfamily lysophospholipase